MLTLSSQANAQKFPDRSMIMVIPFAAGGPTDILGRVVAGRMSEVLGQQVVVENVTGAGGMTGSARVARSDPDGYQFVLATVGSAAQGQTLYKKAALQYCDRFHPSHSGCRSATRADHAQGPSGQQLQEVRRLCQGASGTDAVRRPGLAPRRILAAY